MASPPPSAAPSSAAAGLGAAGTPPQAIVGGIAHVLRGTFAGLYDDAGGLGGLDGGDAGGGANGGGGNGGGGGGGSGSGAMGAPMSPLSMEELQLVSARKRQRNSVRTMKRGDGQGREIIAKRLPRSSAARLAAPRRGAS